ncbi:hypothetical protein EH223_00135 [candidate division KSB1 bacterium]|nr:hypothetical protein [candidate division KSB1 bacterium]RQW07333.1 MAG: hypothetical protein EH223_00135 [candidate division KSB1 bacterium]
MKFKVIPLLGALAALTFVACDWNSHTEPELTVNNAEVLGGAIYVNVDPLKPRGIRTLFINEGDTVKLQMSTLLLQDPNYSFTPYNGNAVKIVKDPTDNMVAYAIALADSGAVDSIQIVDNGNSNAFRKLYVNVVDHWADPDYFQFIGTFDGHYYYISNNLRTWVEAEEICREAGGYMAAIGTAEENAFLEEARGRVERVWIGIRLNNVNGSFKITTWANGEPVEYKSFNSQDAGIFAEFYYYMDANGSWENWHEISYNYFLEME